MSGMYLRKTEKLNLSDAPAALLQSLYKHSELHQLKLDNLNCWLTQSENPPATGFVGRLLKRRANLVDPNAWHLTLLVVHPTHLLVCTQGENTAAATLSSPLLAISLSLPNDRMAEVSGLGFTITGFHTNMEGQAASYFIGLGPEAAGHECLAATEEALRSAKNPR